MKNLDRATVIAYVISAVSCLMMATLNAVYLVIEAQWITTICQVLGMITIGGITWIVLDLYDAMKKKD